MRLRIWLGAIFLTLLSVQLLAQDRYIVEVNSSLNVRSTPSANSRKVAELMNGDTVDVISVENGWAKIAFGGKEGYAKDSFLRKIEENTSKASEDELDGFMPGRPSIYTWIMSMSRSGAWTMLLVLLALETAIMVWLKNHYPKEGTNKMPFAAYFLMIIGTLLTVLTIASSPTEFETPREIGDWPYLAYTMTLLGTGLLMTYSAWRIKMCGMEDGKWTYHEYRWNYSMGRWLGNLTWLILIIGLMPTKKWITYIIPHYRTSYSIGGALELWLMLSLICLVLALAWKGVVRLLLHTANDSIVVIIGIIVGWSVFMYGCDCIWYSESELLYVLTLGGFCCTGGPLMIAFLFPVSDRCSNCHSFASAVTQTDELGINVKTSTSNNSVSTSSIKPKHKNGEITDAYEKVRTTTTSRLFRNHLMCKNCAHTWTEDREEVLDKDRQVIEKGHTEKYWE